MIKEGDINSLMQLNPNGYYTYFDYITWKFKERVELYKGTLVKMSPAPSRNHQEISKIIGGELYIFLKNDRCKMYMAPFDVRLPISKKPNKTDTVVQPDISVICDHKKLDDAGCNGAPDLVVEIISPGNSTKELGLKFELYEESQVKEYWVVNPLEKNVTIFSLDQQNKYISRKPYIVGELVKSKVLHGFEINTSDIFKEDL